MTVIRLSKRQIKRLKRGLEVKFSRKGQKFILTGKVNNSLELRILARIEALKSKLAKIKTKDTPSVGSYECEKCDRKFGVANGLTMHTLRRHGKNWSTAKGSRKGGR
jgi:hypothetical protein